MALSRRRKVVVVLVALASVSLLVGPAAALHGGASVDCGDAGSFTLKATPNGAGFESPGPTAVLLFEEGGTLSVLRVYRNSQLIWDPANVGLASNNADVVTCSFMLQNGVVLEITGVFTGR